MFGWMKANESYLYGTKRGARVAVLYSPASRDYIDQAKGTGLYVTTTSAATEWWSTDPVDSAYSMQYLAEYRGMVKLLVHNHIPFDVVVNPSAEELAQYETIILPDLEAISDEETTLLSNYTSGGGHLIATGPNPGGWDKYGSARSEYALAAVLGVTKASALPVSKTQAYGAGEARFFSGLLGKKYFTNASDAVAAASSLLTAINETTTPWLTTDANKKVHLELSQTDNQLILQYVNFIGVTGTFSVVPTTVSTTLNIPADKAVENVELTSPDNATPAMSAISFTRNANGSVTFSAPVTQYTLAVVTLPDSAIVTNQPPVAVNDNYSTTKDKALTMSGPGLLVNDSDPDGNTLSVSANTLPANGTVNVAANGGFTYTPAAGFIGTDSFGYTISDGNGGNASATATITIKAPPGNDRVGVWRPSERRFYFDANGSGGWDAGDRVTASFGIAADVPIKGDWNGDGYDEIGIWRSSERRFYLDVNGNGAWDAGDVQTAAYGLATDVPVIGDWNGNGVDDIGIWRSSERRFYLDVNGNGAWDAGDVQTAAYGLATDVPVAGKW
jgi:hypothetical protein